MRRPARAGGLAALARGARLAAVGAALVSGPASAGEPSALEAPAQRAGYSAGYAFGLQLAELERSGAGIELEAVLRGLLDAFSGAGAQLSDSERSAALASLSGAPGSGSGAAPGVAVAERTARRRGFVDDYAALNAKRAGVVVLPSGVQYEVLATGDGRRPDAKGAVRVSYRGTLADGEVFDSTDGEEGGATRLRLDEIVVPGLREALLLMREGDRWRVVIPPAMGFARAGNNMLRRRDLIYEIELLSIEPPG